jgi:NADH-quinone oxidoreductase subunit L
VSALIHAATMVTAGVYMIGRTAVLFEHAPITMAVVAAVGVATALMAGTIGLVQNDIKRVLAYSTVSQLGFMFLAMGVGAFAAGIFHLYTHAFFKALLFLGSGAVIHALAGEQDIRNMGGLKQHLPITYWTFLIGALAIAGVPLLSGFFSKDEILYRTFITDLRWPQLNEVLYVIGVLTSLLTAIYMFRLVFLTFHGERRHEAPPEHPEEEEPAAHGHSQAIPGPGGAHGATLDGPAAHGGHGHGAHGIHDAPWSMAIPLIVLAVGSVFAGYVGVPHALKGNNRIERFLEPSFRPPSPAGAVAFDPTAAGQTHGAPADPADATESGHGPSGGEHAAAGSATTELLLMALSSGVAFAGIGIAAFFWLRRPDAADATQRRFAGVHRVLLGKYYVDELYDATVVHPIQNLSTDCGRAWMRPSSTAW